jgi:Tfp pilus assembly protein PilN
MKIPINLASQPFRRDRAMLVASGAVSVALLLTLGLLVYLAMLDRSQLADLHKDIARLNQQIRGVSAQQAAADAVLRKPENAVVLERSQFINNLLVYKGVSWSRLFTDLEKTIPVNVKVLGLHPSVSPDSRVLLDLTLGAESREALIQCLKALEVSPVFGDLNELNNIQPTQTDPLYKCHVTVNYAQKL